MDVQVRVNFISVAELAVQSRSDWRISVLECLPSGSLVTFGREKVHQPVLSTARPPVHTCAGISAGHWSQCQYRSQCQCFDKNEVRGEILRGK